MKTGFKEEWIIGMGNAQEIDDGELSKLFVLCCRPIALCVLCVDTGDWVYKVNRVINRLMIETQDPLHLPVCRPFISINQRAWLYVSLDNGQKSTRISPSHKL